MQVAALKAMRNATFASCDWIPVLQEKRGIPQLGCTVLNHLSLPVIPIKDFLLPLNDLVS